MKKVELPRALESLQLRFNTTVDWDPAREEVRVKDAAGERVYRKKSEDPEERRQAEFYLELVGPGMDLAEDIAKHLGGRRYVVAAVDLERRVVTMREEEECERES